jgi:predicted RNA-binding protein with PUA-like domain
MNYHLMKSEGDCYSIDHLKKDKVAPWTGVRNFQARNYMKDMRVGDLVLFYHSNGNPSGVYGLARVVAAAHPDLSAQDKKDEHYDSKSTPEKPIWECVDVEYVDTFKRPVSLEEIKGMEKLRDMKLLQKGSRLSVMPVTKPQFLAICKLGGVVL